MKKILATLVASTMLLAPTTQLWAQEAPSTLSEAPTQVLAMLFQTAKVGDIITWTLVTEPVKMETTACLVDADILNNDPSVPFVMMCMPLIVDHTGEVNM